MRGRHKRCNARTHRELTARPATKDVESHRSLRVEEQTHTGFSPRNHREIHAHEKIVLTFAFEILSP
jgi:hypothetical protein